MELISLLVFVAVIAAAFLLKTNTGLVAIAAALILARVNGKRKGRFELEFYGQEDLQNLLDALMKLK